MFVQNFQPKLRNVNSIWLLGSIYGRKKLNLKTILIFCLIGFPLVFFQSALSQQDDVGSINDKYVNDDYGYSIIPPKNWVTSTMNDPSYGEIAMFTQNDGYQGDFPPYFTLFRVVDERIHYDPNYDIEKGKQSFVDGMVSSLSKNDQILDYSIKNSMVQEFQDGWHAFAEVDVLVDDGEEGMLTKSVMIMFVLKTNEMYELVFYSSPEDYNKSYSQFVDSYNTFQYQMNLEGKTTDSFVGPKSVSNMLEENGLADFVDPNKDPTHYINRYYSEPAYKQWFDKNYPGLTIEEAVGYNPSESKFKVLAESSDVLPENNSLNNNFFYSLGELLGKFIFYGIPSVVVFWLLARKFKWF